MSRRVAVGLAWSLAGLSVVMFVGSVVLFVFTRVEQSPGDRTAVDYISRLFLYVPFLAFPVVGALVASKRPRNAIGWICLLSGLLWLSPALGDAFVAHERATTDASTSSVKLLDALIKGTWPWSVGLPGVYMILLFPDGRLPSRRWRPFAWFAGTVIALMPVLFLLPLQGKQLEQYPWLIAVVSFSLLVLPACILASAISLVLRYRRSGEEVREQIKWLAFAASLVGVVYFGSIFTELLFAPYSLITNETPPLWVSLQRFLLVQSFAAVPIAVGFAILKYRLYDIDVIINRALVYGSLTLMLLLVYFGGVVTVQTLFRTLTGQQQQPQLAVVISTLAIAALFNPLRRRVQAFIDRRFYRKKYDARKTLEAFSAKLRDETDLESLHVELMTVVQESMQPEHVSLWLRQGKVSPTKVGPTRPAKVKSLHRE
jgi:hypothetical protein